MRSHAVRALSTVSRTRSESTAKSSGEANSSSVPHLPNKKTRRSEKRLVVELAADGERAHVERREEILGDAPLSEVWYSGVLGGVPVGT